jgi:putative nucleotidyltransferase with HDIG domain
LKDLINKLFKNHAFIYRVFLYFATVALLVYLFPKGTKFNYDIQEGKPWLYENYYAPFDFTLEKSDTEVAEEKKQLLASIPLIYNLDKTIEEQVKVDFFKELNLYSSQLEINDEASKLLKNKGLEFINTIYNTGFITDNTISDDKTITIISGNKQIKDTKAAVLYTHKKVLELANTLDNAALTEILLKVLKPNLSLDKRLNEIQKEETLADIAYAKALINKGTLIIQKGQLQKDEKFGLLNAIKQTYQTRNWGSKTLYWIIGGYLVLVGLALLMLLLFVRKYRIDIFKDNTRMLFLFFNIVFIVGLTTYLIKLNTDLVYLAPLAIVPIIIKAFFDARLGLFAHVITVLILGFIVPNSFEFIFLQIIAGMITLLTVSELYKRANLFISVGQIALVYLISYLAFRVIQSGNIEQVKLVHLGYLLANGVLVWLLSQLLIYIYEKTFSLVSDISLLELSNTSSPLLKELADKAPGTFHHSLQVANLAEAVANEIGANAMLTRVGALYHDIGKIMRPTYFTENQMTGVNKHNELTPKESAKIIINHVLEGIQLAKNHNLPDRIIDFIRTHHGTTSVYYFYKKECDLLGEENVDIKDFQYPGPMPFSKETAILMMCDSVEAASKSLKTPSSSSIDTFVEKIIDIQMSKGQFLNANVTFKEIELIKKVLKKKLNNIYHLRIEYPD